ncbi:putative bifunctional diguanylate cyclase/phosphodiesterase [Roseomonas haemaphysalidis]|uniref:EAL domain-containing protein n=1 Tax=Roseomonas haemaphysalidis TaxID=2768162 RepID=A0ABS3KLF5_9PROT|nr:EAL domain-containing protein [Roseomonas haemaphysalidis]MBO1078295.1 EAL domain-containing protein [Roseomonas haemaphysalidis]
MTGLSALAALLFALALPATFFAAARFRVLGALEASATLHALEIAELSRTNPAFWAFEGVRVRAPEQGRASGERRRVFDASGRLILESAPAVEPAWPLATYSEAVLVDGKTIGSTEAARSLLQPLLMTLLVASCSTLLATVIFALLRVLPLRLLDEALHRASYLAAHDLLTGLPNRGLFADRLTQALKHGRRDSDVTAVLCLDLDRFKEVNDTLGHAAGDELLQGVAKRLSGCLRENDTLARLGGDEFAVIQLGATQPETSAFLARRLIAVLEEPFALSGGQACIGLSVGIGMSEPGLPCEPAQLMRNADLALYQAKEAGRGGYRFFATEMNQRLQERRALEADLRQALASGGFRLAFQPQINLEDKRIIGAEALLRWDRPGHGNMPPDQFIGVAEETGLIGPIGAWAINEACRQAMLWPAHMNIAVNVSPVQFRQAGLFECVTSALQASGLSPARLELEITESVLLNDTEDTLAMLGRLRGLGVKIAMDDFGTGYSSLGYLQKFPFDKLKIDRSFVRDLGRDPNASAIVSAVVGMSRALGVRANAEGVEEQDQAALLLAEGCEEVQGYFFGKPMSAEEFSVLLH